MPWRAKQVDGCRDVAQVAQSDRPIELVGIAGSAGRADAGLVRSTRPRLERLPLNAEPDQVEPQALHARRVGVVEVPRLAGVGIGDVRRVLVDDVDAVEDHDAAVRVVDVRAAR